MEGLELTVGQWGQPRAITVQHMDRQMCKLRRGGDKPQVFF
jgi:hypothetical protein